MVIVQVTKSSKSGWLMVNVETYGGGLWYTWFDRDLGLVGEGICFCTGLGFNQACTLYCGCESWPDAGSLKPDRLCWCQPHMF